MNITTARAYVRDAARNAGDSSMYPDEQIDRAIIAVLTQFCQNTKAVTATSALVLTASSNAIPALPTGFRPETLLGAYLNDSLESDVEAISFTDLRAKRRESGTSTGLPTHLAFTSWTAGQVFPTPDDGYTLSLFWWVPFTGWTPGLQVKATATATIGGGAVTALAPTNCGGPYSAAPAVTITGGSGSNATATASIDANGRVTGFTITNAGSGYTTAPTVSIAGTTDPGVGLPDDWLAMILPFGPPAWLQHNEPQVRYASASWQKYQEFENSMRGAGTLRAATSTRVRIE